MQQCKKLSPNETTITKEEMLLIYKQLYVLSEIPCSVGQVNDEIKKLAQLPIARLRVKLVSDFHTRCGLYLKRLEK